MKNSKRHKARRYAVQALYQWDFEKIQQEDILINQFLEKNDNLSVDWSYFEDLVTGTIRHLADINSLMIMYLDRDVNVLSLVELAVLRLATYELLHRKDVPYKVIIDEALWLVKEFGAEEGYKYVNAVLDVLSYKVRKEGCKMPRGRGPHGPKKLRKRNRNKR
ncbi:NusB antitermination factor [Coxiella endosymbiont of Amblyomma americanum]|nr:transcription antitermination factor NusB [Coxiella endosymbiont of Amblyomma americanum]AJC50287.1 NusB antitermination factor [Coxiella endosymbiont of Amblyomma americanum]AUJ58639.1 N utilization substance protein B [Coxiella-like endosymbiont of Amblyomma americanum]